MPDEGLAERDTSNYGKQGLHMTSEGTIQGRDTRWRRARPSARGVRIILCVALACSALLGLDAPRAVQAASCPVPQVVPMPHPTAMASVSVGGCAGYLIVNSNGRVAAFGAAAWAGDVAGRQLGGQVIGITATTDGRGYWLLASDGGVFSFGSAGFYGSTGGLRLNQPVVAMAATPDGQGYWLVASDGGIFSFGSALFYGSTGSVRLNSPVVGMASSATGRGYWLVASDGGVFTFGDASFYGSLGSIRLNRPVVGMVRSASGGGYFMVASDGGVFTFGDAPFLGSLGSSPPPTPIRSLTVTGTSRGYYAMDSIGSVFSFGDAPYLGGTACPANDADRLGVDPNLMASTGSGSQLVTVRGASYGSISGTLTAWEQRPGGCWGPHSFPGQPAIPWSAQTGYAGYRDNRREGDGSIPTGIWGIEGTMYGISPAAPSSRYAYHPIVPGDFWVENPASPFYNTFQHASSGCSGNPFGGDTECLWQATQAYQHLAVIAFNPPPTHNPIGAGIFLHDANSSGHTAGCTALPPGELDAVLGWLDPGARPSFAVGVGGQLLSF